MELQRSIAGDGNSVGHAALETSGGGWATGRVGWVVQTVWFPDAHGEFRAAAILGLLAQDPLRILHLDFQNGRRRKFQGDSGRHLSRDQRSCSGAAVPLA